MGVGDGDGVRGVGIGVPFGVGEGVGVGFGLGDDGLGDGEGDGVGVVVGDFVKGEIRAGSITAPGVSNRLVTPGKVFSASSGSFWPTQSGS